MTTPAQIAVLDDYLDLASKHISDIKVQISPHVTIFRDKVSLPMGSPLTQKDKEALVEKLRGFEVISTMRERAPFPGDVLRRLPNLRLLLLTAMHHSAIDLVTAKELGIVVATAPGKGRSNRPSAQQQAHTQRNIVKGGVHPTTQHTWSLILALCRNVAQDDHNMKYNKGWQTYPAVSLNGKVLGICGLGKLGASTARVGMLAWGMTCICWSENITQEKADQTAANLGLPIIDCEGRKTFQVVSKKLLFEQSQVLSIHYVLSERSKGIVGRQELASMRPDAFLINTSRGSLIDEDTLFHTLEEGRIAGAALDVFSVEPLLEQDRWRSTSWGQGGRSRVVLTPHMGYVEEEVMQTWYDETAENIERWLNGQEIVHRLA